MSYMCLGIAVRAIQDMSIDDVYIIAEKAYGRKADDESTKYKGGLSYFKYENEKNNIKVYEIEGKVCLDYIIKDEIDVSFINETLSFKNLASIKRWLKKSGFDVKDLSFKVLYYHNGGCAGLCEVK